MENSEKCIYPGCPNKKTMMKRRNTKRILRKWCKRHARSTGVPERKVYQNKMR